MKVSPNWDGALHGSLQRGAERLVPGPARLSLQKEEGRTLLRSTAPGTSIFNTPAIFQAFARAGGVLQFGLRAVTREHELMHV
jgi:hypothetical protein